jgi:hypothetical protein
LHEPSVRARHLKNILEALASQRDATAVLAEVPPACRVAIQEASGIDWLDVGLDLEITAAAYRSLGPAGADACFRGLLGRAMEGPLLRSLVVAAQRLFDLEPGALARWIPKAWTLMFRECGAWQVRGAGERGVELTLSALPPRLAEDPVWPRSVAASLEALFDVAEVTGQVALAARPGPALLFRVTWEARGRAERRSAPAGRASPPAG